MELIKFLIGILVFSLGYCIWKKTIDVVDGFLKKKMNDKLYNALWCNILIITYIIIIYTLFFK